MGRQHASLAGDLVMPLVRIFPLAALGVVFGCNAALGIHEKERGVADSGAPADGGSYSISVVKPPARADGTTAPVHLVRGSSASLDVSVERSGGFDGAVVVLVSGLARGVTADPLVV